MSHPRLIHSALLVATALALASCDQAVTAPDAQVKPSYSREIGSGDGPVLDVVSALALKVDDFNAQLAASGSTVRLDYPWLFRVGTGNDTIGTGTDPFARLRTGSRWTTLTPTYILDESDYTTDLAAADVDATLVAAYDTWNNVANSDLTAVRGVDPGTNMDVLDGYYDPSGNCLTIYDLTSPSLDLAAGLIYPEADIVVGGWAPESYFSSPDCLGSEDIIAVTWTFIDVDEDGNPVDSNHDQYFDRVYVEQFYNPRFEWVVSGSQFLDYYSGVDLQTIAVHEDGHAHGLGHFGGPVVDQQWKLKGQNRVFSPEAVMNPYYLNGEKRALYSTDRGALRTMYSGH